MIFQPRCFKLALFFAAAFVVSPRAFAFETNFDLNSRLDLLNGTKEIQSEQGLLKVSGGGRGKQFSFYAEGFFSGDLAEAAKNRRTQSTAALQEAYFETRWRFLFARVGRQPVRWSESWLSPSLDIWTARRYNRAFFDPLAEQLIHSTGVLISAASDKSSLDFFQALWPAVDQYPKPLPESTTEYSPQFGLRGKTQLFGGLDVSALYALRNDDQVYGFNSSYAFESVVPKIELGTTVDRELNRAINSFASLELDFFIGTWSILPQIESVSLAPAFGPETRSTYFYMPIRYSEDAHSFEVQILKKLSATEFFGGALYTYSFANGVQLSGVLQDYEGETGTLFGLYKDYTGGFVGGVRLAYLFSI